MNSKRYAGKGYVAGWPTDENKITYEFGPKPAFWRVAGKLIQFVAIIVTVAALIAAYNIFS